MAAVVVMPYEKMFLIDEAEYMKINKIQYPDPNTASMITDDNDDDDDDSLHPNTTTADSRESIAMGGDDSHANTSGIVSYSDTSGSVRSRRSPRNVVAQEIMPRGKHLPYNVAISTPVVPLDRQRIPPVTKHSPIAKAPGFEHHDYGRVASALDFTTAKPPPREDTPPHELSWHGARTPPTLDESRMEIPSLQDLQRNQLDAQMQVEHASIELVGANVEINNVNQERANIITKLNRDLRAHLNAAQYAEYAAMENGDNFDLQSGRIQALYKQTENKFRNTP